MAAISRLCICSGVSDILEAPQSERRNCFQRTRQHISSITAFGSRPGFGGRSRWKQFTRPLPEMGKANVVSSGLPGPWTLRVGAEHAAFRIIEDAVCECRRLGLNQVARHSLPKVAVGLMPDLLDGPIDGRERIEQQRVRA